MAGPVVHTRARTAAITVIKHLQTAEGNVERGRGGQKRNGTEERWHVSYTEKKLMLSEITRGKIIIIIIIIMRR